MTVMSVEKEVLLDIVKVGGKHHFGELSQLVVYSS